MPKQREVEDDSEQFFSSESEDFESDNEGMHDELDEDSNPQTQVLEKDAEEEELERLVLGNRDTFRKLLFERDVLADLENLDQGKQLQLVDGDRDESPGPEDIQDSDLFMIDTGGAAGASAAKTPISQPAPSAADAPAWEDSDDERLAVSLATASRLRKLRIAEGEDVVSGTEYSSRLRRQYLALNPLPKWAKEAQGHPAKRRRRSSDASDTSSGASGEEEDDGDVSAQPLNEFLRDVTQLSRSGDKTRKLKPEVIDIQRTRDIPDKHTDAVTTLAFHPKFPILLSSSPSSMLFLHHLDATAHPTPNPKLTSIQARQVDVRRSEFRLPFGDKIFFAGRRKFFHSWDLETGTVQKINRIQGHRLEHNSMEHFRLSPCGQYLGIVGSTRKGGGVINVLNVATSQWVASARLDSRGGIADFAWWRNSQGMTILGKSGQLGEWSLVTKRFLGLWRDEGCIGGIVLALGGSRGPDYLGGDRWVAVGSNTGIMNIYDRLELVGPVDEDGHITIKELPEPKRRFDQLVTAITTITFSPDGQLLAFASEPQKDAFRLVHVPSCTVYRNWPTDQTPLGRVTAVAFSTKSDILSVGNDKGKIRLWEIRH
ncbi:related to UTP18 Possible U3 snoRNP protein involved in maturation of pre-18S rRNA [Cephalotrichum gorgonifer]|uniref:Related to UTP18 Possible U3 snoRNP protein involved in maturation of pre-18S rRNA n=1 Tax=Cephalotrichum gorgonifer TaxID=2041049 RepID=A0AAE8SU48_9PEZI|nr:related to UTP18 Possible U3 snoRNP protein involved in maturation of pre-18S rRNA [Cephalotrichum gorgonifer]